MSSSACRPTKLVSGARRLVVAAARARATSVVVNGVPAVPIQPRHRRDESRVGPPLPAPKPTPVGSAVRRTRRGAPRVQAGAAHLAAGDRVEEHHLRVSLTPWHCRLIGTRRNASPRPRYSARVQRTGPDDRSANCDAKRPGSFTATGLVGLALAWEASPLVRCNHSRQTRAAVERLSANGAKATVDAQNDRYERYERSPDNG